MKKTDVYQIVTNNILAAMENGIIPWRKPFKTSFSPIPINFSTGKVYRGINVFLLNLACLQFGYPKNSWLTFKQAKQMGGNVKKGQSSESILFWKSTLISEKNISQEEESELINKVYIARIYNVFNIDQCEGIDKDIEILLATPGFGSCEDVYANYPEIKPKLDLGLKAMYILALDQIRIPGVGDFHSTSEYYATLFHELVHSTGHTSRLNREGISEVKRSDEIRYSQEELIAEMGASFLCAFTGIENPDLTNNSAAYLQSWLQVFKQDKTMVVKAASQAQKAVDFIFNN
ncbi:MAG: zincin-like metallopeptidase domain-containing protein [Bacteroidales bacterium]|nr:zincin-like metallopeptidase domain-containing protein [Bacteroidales bacterium]